MIKHVILWQLKDELSAEEIIKVKADIKKGLEDLKGVVPGIIDICVQTEMLDSSNADVMLDSSFESVEALKGYAVHPAHVKVADEAVRPFTKARVCVDFEA
ncbi:MAG: Dabb family protein [Lachnospiraceae bacterium]|nr:Dabb family protein [Lachnospiraceae bacterium]